MLTETFWAALERVGSLALLAALLWLGWKYIRDREGREHLRMNSLVEFVQHQVELGRESQDLYVTKLEETHEKHSRALADLLASVVESTMTTNLVLADLKSAGGEEHKAILDAVMSFDALRHTATQEHVAILRAIEQLERRDKGG